MRFRVKFALLFLAFGSPALPGESKQTNVKTGANRPVTSQEIEQLKRQIYEETSSSVEAIFDYHAETGDLNNRLDFLRYGARLNWKLAPATVVYFTGTRTSYMTLDDVLNEWGTSFTAGVRGRPSDRFAFRLEGGATRFSTDTSTIHARGSFDFKPSGTSDLYLTASRSNVEESLLSAAGIRPVAGPFAGELVGRVMDNRVGAGGRLRLPARLDFFVEGGAGTREGSNVDSNFFKRAGGGVGFNIVAGMEEEPVSLLRASYALDYFGFDENRLGFGGASLLTRRGNRISQLGADGISPAPTDTQPGVGGYFSPQRFISNVVRVEMQGRPGPALEYRLSAFIGSQSFTGSDPRQAAGFSGSLILRLTARFTVPVTYWIDNFGPFSQQTLSARLVVRF